VGNLPAYSTTVFLPRCLQERTPGVPTARTQHQSGCGAYHLACHFAFLILAEVFFYHYTLVQYKGASLRAHSPTASATHVRSRRIGKRLAPRHDLPIGEIDIDAMTCIVELIAVCS
jgi:hypothetical protein